MTKLLKPSFDAEELARIVERKVYEAMKGADADFQPFFQPKEVSKEIRARQNAIERNKFSYVYDDYGCLVCGTRERAHRTLWMCSPCFQKASHRLRASIQKRLDEAGKPQEFIDTAALAKQPLVPAIPKLLYDTGELLAAGSAAQYRRTKEAAVEAGVDFATLHYWIQSGKIGRPSLMLNKKDWLWTDADVERLKKFKQENAAFQGAKRSMAEVARQVGISENTLDHWVRKGKIRPSLSKGRLRYWTDEDIERLRELLSSHNSQPLLEGGK